MGCKRELANTTERLLSIISEKLWQSGEVPNDWIKANVKPTLKQEAAGSRELQAKQTNLSPQENYWLERWNKSGWSTDWTSGLNRQPSRVWGLTGGWLWMVWSSRVNTRPVPFASWEMTQTRMDCIFTKFVEAAAAYAGRQSCWAERSKSRGGLTRTSEKSAKTRTESCTGRGQPTATVWAGGAWTG